MLSSKERAELRAKANGIDTTLIVGKGGISDTLIAIPFCWSEQAVRSTKSRLNKKLDIPTALQTDTPQV